MSSPHDENQTSTDITESALSKHKVEELNKEERGFQSKQAVNKADDTVKSLLGLAYESSDSEN